MIPHPSRIASAALLLLLSANASASSDSVVTFNEVHYHLADAATETEWIELHNQMVVRVDLSGWRLAGGVNFTFPEGTIMEPGSFLLVAQDPAMLAGALGPFAGSLDNSGESVRLRGRHDRLMDEIDYGDDDPWPVGPDGSGATLAKVHSEAASAPARNWRASRQLGGTPGAANFPFDTGPELQNVIASSGTWRYEASGSDHGTAWRASGFDDSTWSQGAAGFASSLVQNPSFEADTFTVSPGYVSGNGPITAWHTLENGAPGGESRIGLNAPEGIATFSNNGLVPDGANVAFIRGGPRSLAQDIAGFVPGDRYLLRYRENGRAPTSPVVEATLGGITVVPSHTATNIENSGQHTQPYYHQIGSVFTASAATHTLALSNLADIGQSALFDNVRIDGVVYHDTFDSGANGTSVHAQPPEFRPGSASWQSTNAGVTTYASGTLVKSGAATASVGLPFSPRTHSTLTVGARLRAGSGNTTKWSGLGFTGTATASSLDSDGVLWVLLQEDGNVILEASESGGTGVLGVSSPGSAPVYPFHANDFNDVALVWDRATNTATVLVNSVTVFNGVPLDANAGGADGVFEPAVAGTGATFTTTGAAMDDFFVAEGVSPATALPFQSATTATYFRNAFEFAGDPAEATLNLSLLAGDGAVIYLNGQEIHRENMPAGAINADTPALSPNADAQNLILPGSALVTGTNVLAVEVHPAAGATNAAFEAALAIVAPPPDPDALPALLINEVAAASDSAFFVEIRNTGASDIDLTGMTLELAGAVDAVFALPASTFGADEYISFDRSQLGFTPTDEDRLFLKSAAGNLIDAARIENSLRGRLGDKTQYPDIPTPGARNIILIEDSVAINEIMYHHRPTYPDTVNGVTHADNPTEWIELHNHSGALVDVSGWSLRDAIRYDIPADTSIPAGGFLVIDGSQFEGSLNNKSDRIVLRDQNRNTVDEVHYFEGGRWPAFADGDGASLELTVPDADNSAPESWAASDESGASQWQTYTYRGQGSEPPGNNNPNFFNEFLMGMLAGGEVLVDDISVVENPDGGAIELIQNGTFEGDTVGEQPDKWRILGNHRESVVADDPDGGGKVLKLVATGRLEHSYNIASTTFANNRNTNSNATYEISFRAKWLRGSPQLNTRLYFNRLSRTHVLPQPSLHGTPGAPNSTLIDNAGPTYSGFAHSPIVPESDDIVRVTAHAYDINDVESMTLHYRIAGEAWNSAPMSHAGGGNYVGIIPPMNDREVIQFYVEGSDEVGGSSFFPKDGPEGHAYYRVGDGPVGQRSVQTLRIIMDPDEAEFMHTSHHTPSNYRSGATVIYNDREVYYGCGVRLRGSSFGRRGGRVGWNVKFPDDQLFRGVHATIAIDGGYSVPIGGGNGWVDVGPGVATNELVYNQMAHRAGGVPATFDDVSFIDAPLASDSKLAQLKMARFGDIWRQSELGTDEGAQFKFELIYHPQGTIDGNPESLKGVYGAVLQVDIRDMTANKEAYRHHYWVQNHSDRDDYGRIVDMGTAFSASNANLKAETDAVLDIDNWMRVLAFQALTGTADTYNNGLAHNILFHVLPNADRKVMAIPWDVDHAFWYPPTHSIFGQQSHRAADIVQIPQNRRLYCGHLLDLCNTGFNPTYVAPWVSHFNQVGELPIASHYTQWISDRRNHVLSRLNALHPQTTFRITTNGGNNFATGATTVTLRGSGWIDVREIILGRTGAPLDVTWTDGDTWEVTIPLLAGGNPIELTAQDHQGTAVGNDTITVTNTGTIEPAADTNIVVSEIMYNPADPTASEIQAGFADADAFEFVELMNIGTLAVDLTGVTVTNGFPFDFSGAAIAQLAPDARVLLVRNRAAFESRHGAGHPVAGEYGDPGDPSGDGGPKLSNGGERLRLADAGGNAIKDFSYDDDTPWPEAADGAGFSLTLIDPGSNPDHALASSWRASAFPGGSPAASDAESLADWMAANGVADPGADAGNGLSQFATFALGYDLAGPAVLPSAFVDDGGRLVIEVRRRSSADAIALAPEFSSNLTAWEADPGDASLIEFRGITPHADGTSTWRWRSVQSVANATKLFVRVVIDER